MSFAQKSILGLVLITLCILAGGNIAFAGVDEDIENCESLEDKSEIRECLVELLEKHESDEGAAQKITAAGSKLGGTNTGGSDTTPSGSTGQPSGDFLNCDGNWVYEGFCEVGLSFTYTLFYAIPAFFAFLAAMVLDFFVWWSIQGDTYAFGPVLFIWEVLRDFANIGIIAILAYIGVMLIFSGDNASELKTKILKTFLIAILINFSFYFSTLIIDLGNFMGNAFYNKMDVAEDGAVINLQAAKFLKFEGDVKSISLAVVSYSNPQKIFETSSRDMDFLGKLLAIVAGGIFSLGLIYMFFSVAVVFVTRTISLWIGTSLSVVAFLTYALPKGMRDYMFKNGKAPIDFKQWLTSMIQASIAAPVFLFFLYVIVYIFQKAENFDGLFEAPGTGSFSVVFGILSVVVPYLISFFLILYAVKITKSLTSEDLVGGVVSGFFNTSASLFAGALPFGALRVVGATGRVLGKGTSRAVAGGLEKRPDSWWGRSWRPKVVSRAAGRVARLPFAGAAIPGKAGEKVFGGRVGKHFGVEWDPNAANMPYRAVTGAAGIGMGVGRGIRGLFGATTDEQRYKQLIENQNPQEVAKAVVAEERLKESKEKLKKVEDKAKEAKKEVDSAESNVNRLESRMTGAQEDSLRAQQVLDNPAASELRLSLCC